jgi:two-component system, OmpR family, sensor kinase
VLVDRDRIEQVLANLLGNAAKYSPDGSTIDVRVSLVDDGALLEVRDAGIGLPPGTTETIFQPFGRAANATRRQVPGMGLGLYISRQIVDQHGGRMWAASPGEGEGTTVSVWLPTAGEAPPA